MKWVGIAMWITGILLIVGLVSYKAWESGDIVCAVLSVAVLLVFGGITIGMLNDK